MWVRLRSLVPVALFYGIATAGIQAQGSSRPLTAGTRADLETQLRAADSANRTEEAFALRRRLRDGDFEVGDRIHLILQIGTGTTLTGLTQSDTVVVEAGRKIILGQPVGDIDLTGVLFPELTPTIAARVSKYFRAVTVRATPLVRLSIAGAVGRAGFFYFPSDAPLGDLIMKSGGQSPNADMMHSEIRRGSTVIWNAADIRTALTDGLTIQSLGLRPGDELMIAEKKNGRSWILPAFQIGATILTLLVTISQLRR